VAVLKVPTTIDIYQKPAYTDYSLSKVHMQNTNEVIKSTDNTEVVLRSILFYDCRLSKPSIDIWGLERVANGVGASMKVEYSGDVYTVEMVDLVPDDTGKPHHYELGLV
jgi:hypothetical protein